MTPSYEEILEQTYSFVGILLKMVYTHELIYLAYLKE
jgi:hypothetical protein